MNRLEPRAKLAKLRAQDKDLKNINVCIMVGTLAEKDRLALGLFNLHIDDASRLVTGTVSANDLDALERLDAPIIVIDCGGHFGPAGTPEGVTA